MSLKEKILALAVTDPEMRSRCVARLAKFSRRHENGCILWESVKNENGYGLINIRASGTRVQFKAHRIALALAHGPIKSSEVVCHSCDTPACINPDHLWIGTQRENLADCTAKGRRPIGVSHGRAKLTIKQVMEVLASPDSKANLARLYGVSEATINNIQTGKKWRQAIANHVQQQGSSRDA